MIKLLSTFALVGMYLTCFLLSGCNYVNKLTLEAVALHPNMLGTLKPAMLTSIERLRGNEVQTLFRVAITDNKGDHVLWQATDAVGKLGVQHFKWVAHDGETFGRQEWYGSLFNFTSTWMKVGDDDYQVDLTFAMKPKTNLNLVVFGECVSHQIAEQIASLPEDNWNLPALIQTYRDPSKKSLTLLSHDTGVTTAHIFSLKSSRSFRFTSKPDLPLQSFETRESAWRSSVEQKFPGLQTYPALASLLGNLAFLTGYLVTSIGNIPATLLTITPSRSTFPRGFLWDEGFHGLVLAQLCPETSARIVLSWLSLQQGGWVPREIALSDEDRSRIPEKFILQKEGIANPPALLFTILMLEKKFPGLLPRSILKPLGNWYYFLKASQASARSGCYLWKGRSSGHSLASGLDDYPRGLFVNEDECHLDLHSWLIFFAKSLSRLEPGNSKWATEVEELQQSLRANLFDAPRGIFADFAGLQPKQVKLPWSGNGQCGKKVECDPESDAPCCSESGWCGSSPAHCDCPGCKRYSQPLHNRKDWLKTAKTGFSPHLGYVTLFPLLLGVLDPVADAQVIENTMVIAESLLVSAGAASLSPDDPLFGSGEDYWCGNIWGNIQLLLVGALRGYADTTAHSRDRMLALSDQISSRFTRAVREELATTGWLREHFSPKTGKGGGVAPFAGWTAASLVLLETKSDWWVDIVGLGSHQSEEL